MPELKDVTGMGSVEKGLGGYSLVFDEGLVPFLHKLGKRQKDNLSSSPDRDEEPEAKGWEMACPRPYDLFLAELGL